jgi:hypothetical protein
MGTTILYECALLVLMVARVCVYCLGMKCEKYKIVVIDGHIYIVNYRIVATNLIIQFYSERCLLLWHVSFTKHTDVFSQH